MPTGRTVHPSTRRHNKTTTTTTMYATSATRCVTRRLKNIFSLHDTSRTRRLCDVSLSRDVRRWDGWFDDGTRLRGSSRPRRATRTTSRCPRSSNPAPRRLVSSFPRVGIISIDLIVDASASIARRRTPNAGTLSTDSLILPLSSLFPSTQLCRRQVDLRSRYVGRAHIFGTRRIRFEGKRRIAFGFLARGRAVAVATRRGVSSTSIGMGGRAADPSGWGCRM